jgi:hypothetical protein
MGCDIHMVAQVRDGSTWKTQKFPNKYFGEWDDEPELSPRFYNDRNYDAFAILANVRNGSGFAGCDTGDGFEFLSDGRGFPDGFEVTGDSHGGLWMGDHSFTWLTLAELESCDWSKTTKQRGWVNGVELKRMRCAEEGIPRSYCGGVSGGQIQHVSTQEIDRRISEGWPDERLSKLYCLLEWEETYAEAAGSFYSEWLPKLRELGQPEDVRIVMGFDS